MVKKAQMDDIERKPLISRASSAGGHHHETYNSISSSINSSGQVSTSESDDSELEKKNSVQILYRRRWYILIVFSLLCLMQSMIWNTWGPLSEAVNVAYGWTNADVALQTNWGCITYIISAAYFSWLMDVKGLRVSCVLTAVLMFFGSAFRCITTEAVPATWLIHIGQIFNGFAGPVLMAGPPLLSAIWFPAYQRTTATSIAVMMGFLGVAGSFIVGPLLVPTFPGSSNTTLGGANHSNGSNHDVVAITRFNIMRLMYIECLCSAVVFIAVLIYFPDKPPSTPSYSAGSKRSNFRAGIRQLLRHWGFWKVSISYSVALGISGIWSSLLNFYVNDLIGESAAGWLGCSGSIACGIAGCVLSRFTDFYARKQKSVVLLLFTFSLCTSVVFTLECMKIMPFNRGILYSMFIFTAVGVQACAPLFFELVCETAFPIAEGLTNGIQTWMNNFVGLIFLLTFMIPSVGNNPNVQWMNWTMTGAIFVCIPILLTYKERYNRLDLDTIIITNEEPPESEQINDGHIPRNTATSNGACLPTEA